MVCKFSRSQKHSEISVDAEKVGFLDTQSFNRNRLALRLEVSVKKQS